MHVSYGVKTTLRDSLISKFSDRRQTVKQHGTDSNRNSTDLISSYSFGQMLTVLPKYMN